jgi:hypothetical protein
VIPVSRQRWLEKGHKKPKWQESRISRNKKAIMEFLNFSFLTFINYWKQFRWDFDKFSENQNLLLHKIIYFLQSLLHF